MVKRPEPKADHFPSPRVEGKNTCCYTSPTPVWFCGVYIDKSTFCENDGCGLVCLGWIRTEILRQSTDDLVSHFCGHLLKQMTITTKTSARFPFADVKLTWFTGETTHCFVHYATVRL